MTQAEVSVFKLNNGIEMPALGLGALDKAAGSAIGTTCGGPNSSRM
jgi:hypothetical protein